MYLEEAKKLGDELWVIVARSSMVKHKPKPLVPEHQRLRMVQSLKMVDHAVLGDEHDMFSPLLQICPDIVALGHDQHFKVEQLENDLRSRGIDARVVRIKANEPCPTCSSGAIIRLIINQDRRL